MKEGRKVECRVGNCVQFRSSVLLPVR